MKKPARTLIHRLLFQQPGRCPKWLLSREGRFDAITIVIQLLLASPLIAFLIVRGGSFAFDVALMWPYLAFGALYFVGAYAIDVVIDALLIAPARRHERIAYRALQRRRPMRKKPFKRRQTVATRR